MTAHRPYERFMRRYMTRQDRRRVQAELDLDRDLDRTREYRYDAGESDKLVSGKKWRRPWWW